MNIRKDDNLENRRREQRKRRELVRETIGERVRRRKEEERRALLTQEERENEDRLYEEERLRQQQEEERAVLEAAEIIKRIEEERERERQQREEEERQQREEEERRQREEEERRQREEEERQRIQREEEERQREMRRIRNERYRREHPNLDELLGEELERIRRLGEEQKNSREERYARARERRRNLIAAQRNEIVTRVPNQEAEDFIPSENISITGDNQSEHAQQPEYINGIEDARIWINLNCPELEIEDFDVDGVYGYELRGFDRAAENYNITAMIRTLRAFAESLNNIRTRIRITFFNDDAVNTPPNRRDTRTIDYTVRGLLADDVFEAFDQELYDLTKYWEYYTDNTYQHDGRFVLPPVAKIIRIRFFLEGVNHRRSDTSGGLLLFYLKENFNVFEQICERYQLYTQNKFKVAENCFVHCLRLSGLFSNEVIESIKSKIMNQSISKKSIKLICSLYCFKVIITKIKTGNKISHEEIGSGEKVMKINLWKTDTMNHYFIDESTNITSFCVRHFNDIKLNYSFSDLNDIRFIVRKTQNGVFQQNRNSATMNSLKFIQELFNANGIEPINESSLI